MKAYQRLRLSTLRRPDIANPASRREVLRIDEAETGHNGGKLAFRSGEPYLYISLGDGGCCKDFCDGHNTEIGNGQDLTAVLEKILRIDPLDPNLTTSSADPESELHDQEGDLIGFNDNWKDIQQPEIEATGLAPTDEQESSTLAILPPALYTAIVRGKNGQL